MLPLRRGHTLARRLSFLMAKAKRAAADGPDRSDGAVANASPSLAEQDDASDAFWADHLPVKPRVLTTMSDNASLRVKGGALGLCMMANGGWYSRLPRQNLARLSWPGGAG